MVIALDTNVIWPLLADTQPTASILTPILETYNADEGLVICAPVYAELLAGPGASIAILDAALARVGIIVDDVLPLELWREAGLTYRTYAARRIASGGGLPRRILADFIIGVHALRKATALMTFNQDDFTRLFPSLSLIVPRLESPATTTDVP